MMRGKWAAGIPPRHLTWVLPDRLAWAEDIASEVGRGLTADYVKCPGIKYILF